MAGAGSETLPPLPEGGKMMGDIADMMLDGTLCEVCGEFIDDDEGGYPRRCAACSQEEPPEKKKKNNKKKKAKP